VSGAAGSYFGVTNCYSSVAAGFLTTTSRGTIGSPTATQSGDIIGVWYSRGRKATDWAAVGAAAIRLLAAGTFTDVDTATKITFSTTPAGSTSAAAVLTIGSDGNLTCPAPYSNNVGAVRPMYINSSGLMGYNASSRAFKENIKYLSADGDKTKGDFTSDSLDWIHKLAPVKFDYKNAKEECQKGLIGLIAEDVNLINPNLISYKRKEIIEGYDSDGTAQIHYEDTNEPETVLYDQLITPLLIEVQALRKELDALNAKGIAK
jgi:hypothetical protein